MNSKSEITLKDRLALDRTYLAKERTVLAYIRTGLALIGVALFIHRFLEIDLTLRMLFSLLFGLPGVYAVLYGMNKIILQRKERKEFEKEYIMLEDDEK